MKFNPRSLIKSFKSTNLDSSLKANIINTLVFSAWGLHESYIINNYNIYSHSIPESIFHIMTLTWQYVGLFIISHDLHHAEEPNLYQQVLGRLSLICYGGFFLKHFSEKHYKHHEYPGIDGKDPDFHDGNPIIWYLKFMQRYINLYQVVVQILIYNLAKYCNITEENMVLFWLIPSVFASIQLFFYGTFLVHEKDGVIKNSQLPKWLITFTSYNFGHHKTHHKKPKLPWFELDEED